MLQFKGQLFIENTPRDPQQPKSFPKVVPFGKLTLEDDLVGGFNPFEKN